MSVLMPTTGHSTSPESSQTAKQALTTLFWLSDMMLTETGSLKTLGVNLGENQDTSDWLKETHVLFATNWPSLFDYIYLSFI